MAKLAYHDCHINYITKLRNNSDSGQILQAQTGLNLPNFSFFFSLKYGNFVPFPPPQKNSGDVLRIFLRNLKDLYP
jgi:hypothetical protein